MDILGISALSNGSWVPAMVNSMLHLNIHGLARSYTHLEKVANDVNEVVTNNDPEQWLNTSKEWQTIKGMVQFIDKNMKSVAAQPVKPPGFPRSPDVR